MQGFKNMKKYRVSGTGIHAIKLAYHKTGQRKVKDVTWFKSLEDAKEQVLKNQAAEIKRLKEERKLVVLRLETIERHIAIISRPVDLDVITDDYLMKVNARMEELNDRIQCGKDVF